MVTPMVQLPDNSTDTNFEPNFPLEDCLQGEGNLFCILHILCISWDVTIISFLCCVNLLVTPSVRKSVHINPI
jgi:hypothetical protein